MSVPRTMKALVTTGQGWIRVSQDTKVPSVRPGWILIKTKALALNPTDWKGASFNKTHPNLIVGCDISGVVAAVGEGVKNVKEGDRIATVNAGNYSEEVGGFAEYSTQDAELVWKIPDNVSWEDAAAMGGVGPHTAWYAWYFESGLPTPLKPATTPLPVLIWAGSTSVGMYAIQLAKASNLIPVTTASPKHHEYLKSLGAAATVDYRDPEAPKKIRKQFPGIKYGLDCISENGSTVLATQAMEGGKLVLLLPVKKEGQDGWNDKVELKPILLYTALGRDIKFPFRPTVLEARPNERAALAEWNATTMSKLVASGALQANPLKKGQGLDSVIEGLQYLKDGKASGEKLAFTV